MLALGLCAALNGILCLPGESEAVKYYSRPKHWDTPHVKYGSRLCLASRAADCAPMDAFLDDPAKCIKSMSG